MKVLNLVQQEQGNIKFTVINFPDGQQDIRIDQLSWGTGLPSYSTLPVLIKSRMNSFRDVELIMCAVSALRNLGVKELHLYSPYLLGARSDRDVTEGGGGTNYVRDVIAPVINLMGFDSVKVMDAHSDVTEACIKGLRKASNMTFIEWVYKQIGMFTSTIWIAPDAGASKKIYGLAEKLDHERIIIASKERDVMTGQIKGTHCEGDVEGQHCLIIDDICDGGKTFFELAKLLKERGANKVYLAVTHGIFSKGVSELVVYIDGIYTTNSIKEQGVFIKQFNVF